MLKQACLLSVVCPLVASFPTTILSQLPGPMFGPHPMQVGSASTSTGMVVDLPQPLSSRHAGLLRSPGRTLPAPSDPGSHSAAAAASAFSHAAGVSAAQVSASAGGAAGIAEQRWTTSNIAVGLGSLGGGSHAASRRMSRNASSRLNVDQDWAMLGPDGQLLQQQLAAMQAPQQRVSLGQVLHGPGVVSRRTSRTLSGGLLLGFVRGCADRAE